MPQYVDYNLNLVDPDLISAQSLLIHTLIHLYSFYRPCHHDNIEVIDYCHHTEKNFCSLYSLTVNHQGKFYSNPHCAQCHGISLNATTCAKRGKTLLQGLLGKMFNFLSILSIGEVGCFSPNEISIGMQSEFRTYG